MHDFRTILAKETREAHERIERELALDADAPLERYIAYLRAMHAVIASVEDAFARDMRLQAFHPAQRRKRPRLEQDLRYFGLAPVSTRIAIPPALPARVGWLYVLEGATLGGRVLLKRLAPRWSLTRESGGAFLAGYGEKTGEMWRDFVEALERVAFSAEEKKACVAGAAQAFSTIEERFRASIAGTHLDVGGDDRGRVATP